MGQVGLVGQVGRWARMGQVGRGVDQPGPPDPPDPPDLFEMRFDLRQGREHDVADRLQAAGADGVERIFGCVPRLVIEVDDIHGRHAGLQERQMIVLYRRRLGDERAVEPFPSGRVPDDIGEPRR